jgi:hypothetical protein
MQADPIEEWQRLTEHYRELGDEELEELAYDFADLTETAQQVLRGEMRMRGLGDPQSPRESQKTPDRPMAPRFASSVDPDQRYDRANGDGGNGQDGLRKEYTWKTLLCECDEREEAWQIREMLKRAGIESWIEAPGLYSTDLSGPRVLVAADQLDLAIEIAAKTIPQDIVDQSYEEVPEYQPPECPQCGAEDPVLESAEPTNSWLCEACGKQWTEPAGDAIGEAEKAGP